MRFVLVLIAAILAGGLASASNQYWGGGSSSSTSTYVAPSPAPSGFVSVAASSLASIESELPYSYIEAKIDTSGWNDYDVTCECVDDSCGVDDPGNACTPFSGKTAFPESWGCDPLVGDDSTNNSIPFNCLWRGGVAQGVDGSATDEQLIFFPDGIYNFDDTTDASAVLRPINLHDHRGMHGESVAGTILQTTAIDPANTVNLIESDSRTNPAQFGFNDFSFTTANPVAWNGGAGASRGTTTIQVADTSNFVEGGWVKLEADSAPGQPIARPLYYVRILSGASFTPTSFDIDRPLPANFTGGNATAHGWLPAEELVFRNMTMRHKYPDHQEQNLNWVFSIRYAGDVETSNVHFHGYQRSALYQNVARVRHTGNVVHSEADKPFNSYTLEIANSSNITVDDNLFYDAPQHIACGESSYGITLAFNHLAAPTPNANFDTVCDGGDGNDCTPYLVGHTSGATAHGTTIGAGYLHCSSNEGDVLGQNGSSSCGGTRTPLGSGSLLFHNGACSESTIVRNYLGNGIWTDWSNGPGNNNFYFGNVFRDGGAPQAGGLNNGGDFSAKDDAGNAGYTAGFRWNPVIINNSLNRLGGGSVNALDGGMDDARITHNVIRQDCLYDGGASPNTQADADCTDQTSSTDVPAVSGASIVWASNDVGVTDKTWSDVMPSAPGYSADPGFVGGSSPFPYIGADMGANGGTDANCLPAAFRHYGVCP